MPVIEKRSVLSGITVQEAMRRQVIILPQSESIDNCINRMIKYKVNAVVVSNNQQYPVGVVSKTDIMGAYYAGFAVETPLENIMAGPPVFSYPDDELEASLEIMQENGIHRVYVLGADSRQVVGVLSYPDIVGLIYRYCRACSRGLYKRRRGKSGMELERLRVKDVMTSSVSHLSEIASLAEVIEALSAYRFGAILIKNSKGLPAGIVSKTDLIIAYKHGIPLDARAETIMNTPVQSCSAEDLLSAALQQMLLIDIQRLFVHQDKPENIHGVLSLSDAARFRSGSCRACVSGRLVAGA